MQAEQFNSAIQVVRSWLPEAEAELKLHSVPDDEDSIMQAIENHEVRLLHFTNVYWFLSDNEYLLIFFSA